MPDLGIQHYLIVGAAMFSLGVAVVVVRRNAIAILCGLELILNGAALNFVALNRFVAPQRLDGQMFAIFVIILAAAEAAIALAILLNLYQRTQSVRVDEADRLKD